MPHRVIREVIKRKQLLVVEPGHLVSEVARLMEQAELGAVVVVENDRLVGLFTAHDALCRVVAQGLDPAATTVGEVMTRSPDSVSPDRRLGYALHIMYERGYRHMPVVEDGKPIGMVSTRDMLGPELKEFVTELGDKQHIAEILG